MCKLYAPIGVEVEIRHLPSKLLQKICLKGNCEELLNMTCLPALALGPPHFPAQLAKGKVGKLQRQEMLVGKLLSGSDTNFL